MIHAPRSVDGDSLVLWFLEHDRWTMVLCPYVFVPCLLARGFYIGNSGEVYVLIKFYYMLYGN